MWRSDTRWCAVLVLCMSLLACSSDDDDETREQDTKPTRTVIAYLAAENSLSAAAVSDVNEMLEAASCLENGDHLIVYVDNTQLPRIYDINASTTQTAMSALTPVKEYDEELNSATTDVMREVIDWAVSNYPADEYGLVLWSHGTGWLPKSGTTSAARRKTFGVDNGSNTTSNSGTQMNISDIADVLAQEPHFLFVLFDACFMQSMEVACELQGCTDCLIASPAEIPYNGAPYDLILPALFDETFNAQDVVDNYVAAYTYAGQYACALSAVDCNLFPEFSTETANLLSNYADSILAADLSGLLNYFDYDTYGTRLAIPDCYDLQGLLLNTLPTAEYTAWKTLLDGCVKTLYSPTWYSEYGGYHTIDAEQYGGIALFIPLEKYNTRHPEFITAYEQTAWGQTIAW